MRSRHPAIAAVDTFKAEMEGAEAFARPDRSLGHCRYSGAMEIAWVRGYVRAGVAASAAEDRDKVAWAISSP